MKRETMVWAAPERVTRDGRRYYSAQYKRAVVARCLEPGASVSGIALEHGFNANLVRKWIRDFGDATGGFLPVVVDDAVPTSPVTHRPLTCTAEDVVAHIESGDLHIAVSNGIRPELLEALVRGLTRR